MGVGAGEIGCGASIRLRRFWSARRVRVLTVPIGQPRRGGDLRLRQPAFVGEQDHAPFDRGQGLDRRRHRRPGLVVEQRDLGRRLGSRRPDQLTGLREPFGDRMILASAPANDENMAARSCRPAARK